MAPNLECLALVPLIHYTIHYRGYQERLQECHRFDLSSFCTVVHLRLAQPLFIDVKKFPANIRLLEIYDFHFALKASDITFIRELLLLSRDIYKNKYSDLKKVACVVAQVQTEVRLFTSDVESVVRYLSPRRVMYEFDRRDAAANGGECRDYLFIGV
jgi:hypothetical protein